jgi:hypothetical protein
LLDRAEGRGLTAVGRAAVGVVLVDVDVREEQQPGKNTTSDNVELVMKTIPPV